MFASLIIEISFLPQNKELADIPSMENNKQRGSYSTRSKYNSSTCDKLKIINIFALEGFLGFKCFEKLFS